jgi:8-oxo-dGTP pyrophosphatase MutT (NUDIX family)
LTAATATSAGGIVIRFLDTIPQFVVGRRRRERDGSAWTLPKGTPIEGETLAETAVREVGEETGLRVRIVAPLDSINYTFVQRRTRIYKTVHYFLMEPVGGSLDAPALLSFDTERSLVSLAAERLPEMRGIPG